MAGVAALSQRECTAGSASVCTGNCERAAERAHRPGNCLCGAVAAAAALERCDAEQRTASTWEKPIRCVCSRFRIDEECTAPASRPVLFLYCSLPVTTELLRFSPLRSAVSASHRTGPGLMNLPSIGTLAHHYSSRRSLVTMNTVARPCGQCPAL